MANQKLSELSGYIKQKKFKQDKRIVVFLVCLFISSILWFLNALDKDYNTTVTYSVKYVNLPENRFLANTPPRQFELKVNAHGFTLLRHKLNLSFTPIIIDVKRVTNETESSNNLAYNISTSRLTNRISSQISNEIKISEVRPENFLLVLDSLKSKNVLVVANIKTEFEPQYNITSAISITPAYVTITGPGAILDTTESVLTEIKIYNKLKKPVNSILDLIQPERTTIEPKRVKINIPIEEFTEKNITVPVTVLNIPENVKIKFFPSEVKVSFLVGLSYYSEITANNFLFTVPYSKIINGAPTLQIQLKKRPEFITDLKFTPETFEYLIEKK